MKRACLQGYLGQSTACSAVLSNATLAKLGNGPACRFLVPSMLTITLGSQATILPNGTARQDVLSLADNAIGSAAGGKLCLHLKQLT